MAFFNMNSTAGKLWLLFSAFACLCLGLLVFLYLPERSTPDVSGQWEFKGRLDRAKRGRPFFMDVTLKVDKDVKTVTGNYRPRIHDRTKDKISLDKLIVNGKWVDGVLVLHFMRGEALEAMRFNARCDNQCSEMQGEFLFNNGGGVADLSQAYRGEFSATRFDVVVPGLFD